MRRFVLRRRLGGYDGAHVPVLHQGGPAGKFETCVTISYVEPPSIFFYGFESPLLKKKENYDFFGGIASRSSSSPATRFCIDHPIKEITMAVIITIANRMVVVVLFGMIKESIKKTGMSPIAIIFNCTCVTCIADPFFVSLS